MPNGSSILILMPSTTSITIVSSATSYKLGMTTDLETKRHVITDIFNF